MPKPLLALFFIVAMAGSPLAMPAAQAADLDSLRASGAVGERFDGLLVARDPAHSDFVKQVNEQRRKIYQQRANSQGVPVDQIGRIYAEQIVGKAPAGTWFQAEDGSWRQP